MGVVTEKRHFMLISQIRTSCHKDASKSFFRSLLELQEALLVFAQNFAAGRQRVRLARSGIAGERRSRRLLSDKRGALPY